MTTDLERPDYQGADDGGVLEERVRGRHRVSVVLVCHDGGSWVADTLDAIAAQTRPCDDVVAVDTGSTDGTAELLEQRLGSGAVTVLAANAGFSEATRAGSALARDRADATGDLTETTEWIWLLHDDSAPDPEALQRLLLEVDRDGSIGVAGPKLLGWYDRRLLLEVGVTIARSGRRDTGLERREQDQGQHDGNRTVLAVSTAGMLVRRDVWERLRGLDPRLGLLRDDVDFGWRATLAGHRVVCVTDAVVHHAEAVAHGRRRIAIGRRPLGARRPDKDVARLDRAHAVWVLLVNLPVVELPFAVVRLTLGTLLRATGWLAGKQPALAWDEILALVTVVARPDRLAQARAARRRTRVLPARAAHRLLAPRGSGLRHLMETVNLLVGPGPAAAAGGAHRAVESGPTDEDAEDLPGWRASLLRRALGYPAALVALGLLLLTLLAGRGLGGDGRLMGGALLPAPRGAGALWSAYVGTWHPVGVGSDVVAPPSLALLAAAASLLWSHAPATVTLVFLLAVPVSGLTAFRCLRPVTPSVALRVWGAATYALLPPVVGAVAAGRISTAVVAMLLPPTARLSARGLGLGAPEGSSRAAWSAGALFAVLCAFAPLLYVVLLVLLVAALAVVRGRARFALLAIAAVPPLALLPWLPALVAHPRLLLLEAGLPGPGLTDRALPAVALPLLHPGGPGGYPMLVTGGLVLAAGAGLLRRNRRALVVGGWLVAIGGLAAALVQTRVDLTVPTVTGAVAGWPGPVLLLAGAGLVVAAVVGAEGASVRVAQRSFGWRQPAAAVLAAVAVATPVLAGAWWVVGGAGDPLGRRDPVLLPAFIAAEATAPARPRTLVLHPDAQTGGLSYALVRGQGPRLGDADLDAGARGSRMGQAVADLTSGRGGDAARALLPFGVRFVLMTRPLSQQLASDLDSVPGLVRVSGPAGSLIWRMQYPVGRVRVLSARSADPSTASVVSSGRIGVDARVAAGPATRLVVLTDRADPGWRATLDGQRLTRTTYAGWAQAFEMPAQGGRLRITHDSGGRPALLWVQLAVVLMLVVLMLPTVRRQLDDEPAEGSVLPPGDVRAKPSRRRGDMRGVGMPLRLGSELRRPRAAVVAAALLLAVVAVVSAQVDPAGAGTARDRAAATRATYEPVARAGVVCPDAVATRATGGGAALTSTDVRVAAPGAIDSRSARHADAGTATLSGLAADAASLGDLNAAGALGYDVAPAAADVGTATPATASTDADGAPLVARAAGALAPGLAAMMTTRSTSDDVRGLASATCVAADTDFWFVGSGAAVGHRGRLYLTNPESVPALVDVTLYGPDGRIDIPSGRGVTVAAGGQQVLKLDALAPDIARFAVHVQAAQGRVAAALRDQQVAGLVAKGADWVPAAAPPGRRLVLPGVLGGDGPRHLQVMATGDSDAIVRVRLLGADGPFVPSGLDVLEARAGEVSDVDLSPYTGAAPVAVELTSDQPVTAGVLQRVGSADADDAKTTAELAYTAAVPSLSAAAPGVVADLRGKDARGPASTLLLSAPGRSATVRIDVLGVSSPGRTVTVPAGQQVRVDGASLSGSAVFSASLIPSAGSGSVYAAVELAETTSSGPFVTVVPIAPPPYAVRVPFVEPNAATGLVPAPLPTAGDVSP